MFDITYQLWGIKLQLQDFNLHCETKTLIQEIYIFFYSEAKNWLPQVSFPKQKQNIFWFDSVKKKKKKWNKTK